MSIASNKHAHTHTHTHTHTLTGMTQGMAQSTASLLRAFGPFAVGTLFGMTYTIHGPAISFGLLALVYLITLVLTFRLPARVEETGWTPRSWPPWLSCLLSACSRTPHVEGGTTSLIGNGEGDEREGKGRQG